jgi:hypothetical protein
VFDPEHNKGGVDVDMSEYMTQMSEDFSVQFKPSEVAETPAAPNLFEAGTGKDLPPAQASEFYTFVMKGMFACKRARPDIHTAITGLSTRVRCPTESDWDKPVRLMKYINGTKDDVLHLRADDLRVLKWWVDASFAVHPDFKSHTGGVMSLGKGVISPICRKQKLNTRSSTEAELVGADDVSVMILWTRLFMEAQGFDVEKNILYQDNKSTILLENNGKRSSSKRTRALNIRYFFLTDQVEKGNVLIEYCPTTEMLGDYMTKPLKGNLFKKFKNLIMGITTPK